MAERKKTDLLHDIIPEKEQTPPLAERSIWGRIPMVVSALNTVFEEWHKRRVRRYSFRRQWMADHAASKLGVPLCYPIAFARTGNLDRITFVAG